MEGIQNQDIRDQIKREDEVKNITGIRGKYYTGSTPVTYEEEQRINKTRLTRQKRQHQQRQHT